MRPMALSACLILAATLAGSQTTPKAGSAERKALMNALRPKIEKALGVPVLFKVDHLKVKGDWAFYYGAPLQKNGKAMDYRKTKLRQDLEDGALDDNCCALFKKVKGKWLVKDWRVGMTDVGWDGWWTQYGAPRSIFPSY